MESEKIQRINELLVPEAVVAKNTDVTFGLIKYGIKICAYEQHLNEESMM